MGAGVECSLAILEARERPDPSLLDEEVERSRKSVTRKWPVEFKRGPWA